MLNMATVRRLYGLNKFPEGSAKERAVDSNNIQADILSSNIKSYTSNIV